MDSSQRGRPTAASASRVGRRALTRGIGGPGSLSGHERCYAQLATATDPDGNCFLADRQRHTVCRLDAAGVLVELAGRANEPGSADGRGADARFNRPDGLAPDGYGGVFVADSGNHTLRHVSAGGHVTTVGGRAGEAGPPGPFGVPQERSEARFYYPLGLAFDGVMLYVADCGNNAIRRLLPDGRVDLYAGSPFGHSGSAVDDLDFRAQARFSGPEAVAWARDGTLWIADTGNHVIRKVRNHIVFIAAGSPGRSGTADGRGPRARLRMPRTLALDPVSGSGTVLCADGRVVRVSADLVAQVTTLPPQPRQAGSRVLELSE